MRVYGRTTDELGNKSWVVIQTDSAGNNEYVYVTALVQVLKLNLGESPFYANYGIPARPAILQQVAPDYYVNRTQQQFAQFFASLIIAKVADFPPTYRVDILTNQGIKLTFQVPLKQLSQHPFITA